jgi:dihydroxyacetone kinase phosphoprotein-dependent L subunit
MDASTFRSWIFEAARLVVENADQLSRLDAATGDGDHGVNMVRGFQAAVAMLEETDPPTPGAVLATAGRALMTKTGGSTGPLYGTGFQQAATALGMSVEVGPVQLGTALQAALTGIQKLGAVAEGDKTMIDALAPAVRAYQTALDTGCDLREATRAAADAAEWGLRWTVGMAARRGRAAYLAARSIGHEDPGAASTVLILRALATVTASVPAHVPVTASVPASVSASAPPRFSASASVSASVGGDAPVAPRNRWAGLAVAPGVVIAPLWRADRPVLFNNGPIDPVDVTRAFRVVATDLDRLAKHVRAQGRQAAGDILEVGALIADDSRLVDAARQAASARDPLRAIHDTIENYAASLDAMPDAALRERAADVRQVGRRVIEQLARSGASSTPPTRRYVLVADEIGPADLLERVGQGMTGAVAVRGGANSHAAIVARSVGLPLVMGVDRQLLDLSDNTSLLVDANAGQVFADPAKTEIARAEDASVRDRQRRALLAVEQELPHLTADGQSFVLQCNVASDIEARFGRDSGVAGVGLLRTELPFLETDRWPAEADHRRALRPILAEVPGLPVTVRILDFTNEKVPPFLRGRAVGLPALLDNPAALAAQLRAVMDLGRNLRLRIMVPMVTSAAEMWAVRAAVDSVVAELGVWPVLVGAMVETVAAVEAIRELCEVADFLSIGTNDLTAQVLGLDRTDPRAGPELTAHPAVLKLIGQVVVGVRGAGRPLSVCGDAGAHPMTQPLLLGAGLRGFSVPCVAIDETRYRLRRLDTAACEELFAAALRLGNADETAALVRESIGQALP